MSSRLPVGATLGTSFHDIGLIVNPSAGAGLDGPTVRHVLDFLGARHVVTGTDGLGADVSGPQNRRITPLAVPVGSGRARTKALATAMAAQGLDLIVVIGGDGTLADVAGAVAEVADGPILCGIGAGTMSAGQLVMARLPDLARLDRRRLEVRAVPALVATMDGEKALAFNDVVLGTTLVGTLGDRPCDLDAAAYLGGRRQPGRPAGIGRPGAIVKRTSTDAAHEDGPAEVPVARGRRIGGVVAGFLSPAFVGQAITGGACLASWAGLVAGCVVSEVPLARVGLDGASVLGLGPVRSSFTALGPRHKLVIEGVREGTVLLGDGNPLAVLAHEQRVEVTVRPEAVRAVKAKEVK